MNSDAISLAGTGALSIPDRARAAQEQELVRAVKHERTYRKCLHCERQLPLMVRALSKPPFCTPVHEHEYRVHMEVLMIARLREAAGRLRMALTGPEVA